MATHQLCILLHHFAELRVLTIFLHGFTRILAHFLKDLIGLWVLHSREKLWRLFQPFHKVVVQPFVFILDQIFTHFLLNVVHF